MFDSNIQVDVFGLDCNKIESKIDDVDNSKIFLVKKNKLNINSPITQQIIDSLRDSVRKLYTKLLMDKYYDKGKNKK